MTKTTKVFVYGTLKKGNRIRGLDKLDKTAKLIGEAVTVDPEFKLFDLGAFPAVQFGGSKQIKGEVWEVSENTLETELDAIEGYPDFYTRDMIETTAGNAWVYHIKDISEYRATELEAEHIIAEWN